MRTLLFSLLVTAAAAGHPAVDRANEVAAVAFCEGRVSYGRLCAAIYGSSYPRLLGERRAAARNAGYEPVCSYADEAMADVASIEAVKRKDDRGASASYGGGTIRFYGNGGMRVCFLIHEAAHHTQPARIASRMAAAFESVKMLPARERPFAVHDAAERGFFPPSYVAAKTSTPYMSLEIEERRLLAFLDYVVSAQEMEIRLQSLNRFFWLRHERVIEGLADAEAAMNEIRGEKDTDVLSLSRDAAEMPAIFDAIKQVFGPKFAASITREILDQARFHL
jgi:hypothetical protein